MENRLYGYQSAAVEKLKKRILMDIEDNQESNQVLSAPTGSGKTIMMSSLIDELLNTEHQMCFIWFTPGKGGLSEQSYESLKKFIPGRSVDIFKSAFSGGKEEILPGEILVLNWETINKKNNILMKDGERTNFKEIMENTRAAGTKIGLIVDESHRNLSSTKSEALIKIINPSIIVEVSATPSNKHTVKVPYSEPRNAGVVKKKAIINKDMGSTEQDEFLWVFEEANGCFERIKQEYLEYNITPLMLINIENSKGGEDGVEIRLTEQEQAKYGRTVANGKLAVWTSKRKENLDNLSDFDNTVEVLIFKQAITEGWDCPRACVLIELRQNMREPFKEQVVGRILRTAKRKHYDNYWLDNAFVFTNDREFYIEQDKDNDILAREESVVLKNGVVLKLPSWVIERNWRDIKVKDGVFEKIFFGVGE